MVRTYKIKYSVFNGKWEWLAHTFMCKRDYKFVIVYGDDDDLSLLRTKLDKNQKWYDDFMETHARVIIDYPIMARSEPHPSILSLFRENGLIYDCSCDCGECNGVGYKFNESRLIKK